MLKDYKSPGCDNITSELIRYGGKRTAKIYTTILQNIWKTKIWPVIWQCLIKSLIITILKIVTIKNAPSTVHSA